MVRRAIRAAGHPVRSAKIIGRFLGSSKTCYVCKKTFRSFVPFRGGHAATPPFGRELDVIGSDINNFSCPYCRCSDRVRHLWMYLDKLQLWHRLTGSSVLHFAPEEMLAKGINSRNPSKYVKADLFPWSPDIERVDIRAIPYPDESFSFLICNHVLEHVDDDQRALSEIFRILRSGGYAILQTPYSSVLSNTFSDSSINTDALRFRYYGQEDHVRIYGRDLFARIETSGLRLRVHTHAQCLSAFDSSRYGVNPREDLILAVKP
jgi:SAM-dependent methyltransferase